MITLQDITLVHTVIDAICNVNSGNDEMKTNESQLNIMEAEIFFCGDDDVIPDDAEIDELDPSEFEMNGDNLCWRYFSLLERI